MIYERYLRTMLKTENIATFKFFIHATQKINTQLLVAQENSKKSKRSNIMMKKETNILLLVDQRSKEMLWLLR